MAFKLPKSSPFRQEADKPKNSFADNSFFTDNMRQGFNAGEYGTYSNPSFDPQTYASESMGEGISSAGEAIADAIADRKKMMTTSRDKPDFSNKIETPRQRTLKEGASPDLDSKIQTAKSRGNLKRAARLEGRQNRRIERQTEGAERIKARQAEKTAEVKKRQEDKTKKSIPSEKTAEVKKKQEDKTKKSIDTTTDGSNMLMKNEGVKYDYKKEYDKNLKPSARLHYLENARHDQDTGSPNKFMGGIAGIAGGGARSGGGGSQVNLQSLAQGGDVVAGIFGRAIQNQQAQQAASGGLAGAILSGNTNLASNLGGGAMDQANPFEGKTFQITPANMMGNAKPTFSEQTQGMAQTAFGSGLERQMSMPKSGSVTQMSAKQEKAFGPGSEVYKGGNTAIYDGLKAEDSSPNQMSPLNSYENPQTVIDRSHGYVASKAAEAFGEIGEELIKKKKGDK